MKNGFVIEVPHGTNYQHPLEFYEADDVTPRPVSSFTVTMVLPGGVVLPTVNGTASHKKTLVFTADQIPDPADVYVRIVVDEGGSAGPEDAAGGLLRIT